MVAVLSQSRWWPTLGKLAGLVGSEVHIASKQVPCWVALGLGLGNLLAGLVFGTSDWLPSFVALDIVYANFACALWVVAVYLGSQPPQARFGSGIAAKAVALAVVVAAMLTGAGLSTTAIQLWRGAAPLDLPLLLAGLYANLGLATLHLVLLAIAMQAILGGKWFPMVATGIVWVGTNLGFAHPLLRFGAPIGPASGMNSFGPFLASQVALGIHWTGFCVVLLAAGRRVAAGRSANAGRWTLRPLGPNAFAVVWTAAVAWLVSGGWILHNANVGKDRPTDRNAQLGESDLPQPVYSRLALDIVISPLERILLSRGTAIAVNSLDVPIPELHFGIPPVLEVVSLHTTGELSGTDETTACHRYRLNRPLEPKETLKITFDLKWIPRGLIHGRAATPLLENGTFVSTADIVPALGCANGPYPFRTAPPVAYSARISTSLDQVAVTAGTLVRVWKENGWSFFEYETRGPISPFTTIHSGHYAIHREVHDNRLVEVFYHPKHRDNVDRMIDAARTTIAQRPKRESGQGVVRIVEVPDYQPFRYLGFLGICAVETRRGRACPVPTETGGESRRGRGQAPPLRADPTERPVYDAAGMVLPYSERGYALRTPPKSESTPPVHEVEGVDVPRGHGSVVLIAGDLITSANAASTR